ncbi:hypothetical protein ABT369_39460 [Dactylosporangium sp. NPDC000244]|uniref:hypothetical protein n=1 Tax=Dactylosporangium sp. NPDC000244 TaxID=3154365 RepID=UPI00332AD2DC
MKTDAEKIAVALVAAGFDPPPYVGEDWIDRAVTWLPEGHQQIVRITSLGNTVSGWQARVIRRQVDADGNTVPSGCGEGIIHVARLFGREHPEISNFERVPV